ncbi:aldo/keto reductase [Paenibacillus taichungensis]|uniref:Aldo/keto reductase n=1 Tax=Paenibacillus taichungensis TaxID=484184 RepID=A0A329QC31_9BACL|nr:aldo/keto reductase [Paenibacillus taichungensis]RAW09561.1 aldo/keto reductase [Paenibacillus taichungensis]
MEYVKLGQSGLDVSKLSLGTMSFGVPERGNTPWSLDEQDSRAIIKEAIDMGINFFSTANMYSDGTSEEILGRALKDFARRDETVIATKVFVPMRKGPNAMGLSRKAIMTEIDNSLKRLGTDYVDLYQIHRWDPNTPIEETMEALHDLVKAGKVRYIGASSMLAWQFAKAQHVAERNGWTRFVSMENRLNLLYREEEREMLPLCKDEGVGITPYLPLAAGRLTRDWNEQTSRSENDQIAKMLFVKTEEADRKVAERVAGVASNRGIPRAQVALAWLLQKDEVTAPIIGSTKISHLEDAVSALSVKLTPEEITRLEELYIPHPLV